MQAVAGECAKWNPYLFGDEGYKFLHHRKPIWVHGWQDLQGTLEGPPQEISEYVLLILLPDFGEPYIYI